MHRNIKLETILFKSEESGTNIMISGFGLATVNPLDSCIKQCGTPGYVAPEILKNHRYGHKVDVFSAGVVLYALLFGCLPFPGDFVEERIT